MRKRVETEMAVAALGGSASDFVNERLVAGFANLQNLIEKNRVVLDAALAARGKRSGYVQVNLRRGAKVRLLVYREWIKGVATQHRFPVGGLLVRAGTTTVIKMTVDETIAELVSRCGDHPETTVKALLGVERARRHVLTLIEEGTRWL